LYDGKKISWPKDGPWSGKLISEFTDGTTKTWHMPAASFLREISWCWIAIIVIGSIDVVWTWHDSIKIAAGPITQLAVVVVFLAGSSWLLRRGRPSVVKISVGRVFSPMAQIIALMMVIAPLSYLIESLHMPLIDDSLGAVDAALGFNWQDLTDLILRHQVLEQILMYAYLSIPLQLLVILTICAVETQSNEIELTHTYILSMTICVIIGGMLPALGEPSPFQSLVHAEFVRARSGHWKIFDYSTVQGIVAFPSFHTAFPVIAVYAVRHSLPALFGIAAVNLLMLVSIPTFGGHYLTDMIGGAIVAIASIVCISRLRKKSRFRKNGDKPGAMPELRPR
jgi:PAP2 superfamily